MKLIFAERAWEDDRPWRASDANVLERVDAPIKDRRRDPFKGAGKPEPLRGDLKGWRSRRITLEDRRVCRVAGTGADQRLEIAQGRFPY